jgi:hypothetical protein
MKINDIKEQKSQLCPYLTENTQILCYKDKLFIMYI